MSYAFCNTFHGGMNKEYTIQLTYEKSKCGTTEVVTVPIRNPLATVDNPHYQEEYSQPLFHNGSHPEEREIIYMCQKHFQENEETLSNTKREKALQWQAEFVKMGGQEELSYEDQLLEIEATEPIKVFL